MDFGSAITAMRNGARVARPGWNGKGMWLCYALGGVAMRVGYKEASDASMAAASVKEGRIMMETSGKLLKLEPFIILRTADGKDVPWAPSQTDMLAMDWQIVPEEPT